MPLKCISNFINFSPESMFHLHLDEGIYMHSRQQHMCYQSFVSLPSRLRDVSVGLVCMLMWIYACTRCPWRADINIECLLGLLSSLSEAGSLTKPGSHLTPLGCLISELQGSICLRPGSHWTLRCNRHPLPWKLYHVNAETGPFRC